ncbi:MAG: CoA transferase [Micrococcales bacterium]|nr:CoA transferase [Micrococcales bacterium]
MTTMGMGQMQQSGLGAPLEGLVVADFSRVLAGPMATMMLADLGARVIKIERPGTGDETRTWGPPWSAHGATYYEGVNRSKESISLDLRDPGDRATALEIATAADVVIENFKPGTMERLGLGYPVVTERNPGVVYCSITGFGSAGGAELPGYDFVVQAVGGLMSITGDPDGDPMKVGVALVDVLSGNHAVIGILAALRGRERTGRGDRIEVNLLSSLLSSLVNQAQAYLETGVPPRSLGNDHPSIAPYGTLRARDGIFAVACGNDTQFRRLCAALAVPELADDDHFATNTARVTNRAALITALEAALAGQDTAHWVSALTAAGVPVGPVNDLGAAVALAESLGLEPTVEVGEGWSRQVRHPVSWTAYQPAASTPPPANGEHRQQVLDWLES